MDSLIAYISIAVILVIAELVYFRIADKCNIIDKPNERSSHKTIVLRGGGIIFTIGLWIWSIVFGMPYPWLLAGVTLAAGISFVDDIHSLPDSLRLVVQFTAMFFVFQEIGLLHWDMWWIIPIALIAAVGGTNIFNFMDGVNGITAGYSLAMLIPITLANRNMAFVEESYMIVAIIGVLVFSLFNFRPRGKAKCFAGDVGSIGMALILVFCVGRLMMATGDITWIVLFLVYGVDGVFLIYMVMQLVISLGFIYLCPNTVLAHWIYLVVAGIVLAVAYVLFMRKYYYLHEQYLKSLEK